MNLTNLAVRLAGILMAAVPAGVQVFMHTRHGDSQHGEMFTPAFYASLLLCVVVVSGLLWDSGNLCRRQRPLI